MVSRAAPPTLACLNVLTRATPGRKKPGLGWVAARAGHDGEWSVPADHAVQINLTNQRPAWHPAVTLGCLGDRPEALAVIAGGDAVIAAMLVTFRVRGTSNGLSFMVC